ncbi:MAG: AzlD domain-containing protein [Cognatishimia sp.]|uniref:AzlD domain-containing protein n=1 Tax=Cognatishimia sp. TaxID=2211648 RepID=UPI003B8D3094
MNKVMLWSVILSLAFGSFGLRFLFIGFIGNRELPAWILRHLRYTAVAILPGLVAPLVLWPAATDGQLDPARLAAALVTLAVGYWRKNILFAVAAGAITLYGCLFLFA